MKLFKLPTTIRMSSSLNELKEILEGEIESSPCSLNLEVRSKGNALLTKDDEYSKVIIQEIQSSGDGENRPDDSQSTTKVKFQVNEVFLLMSALFTIRLPLKLDNEAIISLLEPFFFRN
eukprot:TCONS_00065035-protein